MTTESPVDMQQMKAKMKATWMAGDFGKIARINAQEAETFVGRLQLKRGAKVLDVACGTGNLSIPAAKAGCQVTGVDIATNLLEQARERAQQEGVAANCVFVEGDAEQLSFANGEFDAVISMYGAMFAPRPDRTASEMLRVCKPGGMIAMANWTPEGFAGKTFTVTGKHVPPPVGPPAPVMWGDPEVVKHRLGAGTSAIEFHKRINVFEYPFPPAEVVEFFRNYFGPTQMAFARLDEEGQKRLRDDLIALWTEHNTNSQGKTTVNAEYLEVRATKK